MTDFYIAKSDGSSPGGVTGSDSNDGLTPSTPKATLNAILQISGDDDTDGDNIFFYGGTYTDTDLNSGNNTNQVVSISDTNKRQHSLIAYLDQEVIFRRGGASDVLFLIRCFNTTDSPQDDFKISGIKFTDSDTSIGAGKLTRGVLAFYEDNPTSSATPTITIENCTFEFSATTMTTALISMDDSGAADGNESPIIINNCTFTLTGSDPDDCILKNTVMFSDTSSVTFTNNTVTVTHTGSGDVGDPLLDLGTILTSSNVTVDVDTGGSVTIANNTFNVTSGSNDEDWEVIKCSGTKNISITNNSFDIKQTDTSDGRMMAIQIDPDPGTGTYSGAPVVHTALIAENNIKLDEFLAYGIFMSADAAYSELSSCKIIGNKIIGVADLNTSSADGTGILCRRLNNLTVERNIVRNNYDGILVSICTNPVVTDNILEAIGDDGDNEFDAVALFLSSGSGGTIKRNKFIHDFGSNRDAGACSLRIDSQAGFTCSDNTFITKLPAASSTGYRYFRANNLSGVNNSVFGGTSTASTFSGNVYINTANTGSSTDVAKIGSDDDVTLTVYKASADPTAKYDPAMLTQNLSKGLSKSFLTEEVINIREF